MQKQKEFGINLNHLLQTIIVHSKNVMQERDSLMRFFASFFIPNGLVVCDGL